MYFSFFLRQRQGVLVLEHRKRLVSSRPISVPGWTSTRWREVLGQAAGPDLPTKVTGVPTGLGVAMSQPTKDVVVPKKRTSDARNGLSCGNFRRRSGWRDDGMTGGWEGQFSSFFFKSFCCWTHVDLKSFWIKDGTFDDLTLAKEVGVCFAFFPCFTFI